MTNTTTSNTPRPSGWNVARLLVALAALLWLICSCSCERRIEHLRRHCPECFEADTLRLADTVAPAPVPLVEHIGWAAFGPSDTLLIERPQYTLQVTVTDAGIDIEGEARPDSVIVERTVELPPRVVTRPAPASPPPLAQALAALAVSLLALWGVLHALRRLVGR